MPWQRQALYRPKHTRHESHTRHEGLCRSIYLWGERSLNPLPDEASRTKREPEKKDPLRGSFFSYRPSAGAAPRSVPTQQIRCSSNIAIADHFPSKTFSFKHHLTGEAWPVIADLFKIQSSYSPTSSQGEPEKKMLNLGAGNRAQHIQSHLST